MQSVNKLLSFTNPGTSFTKTARDTSFPEMQQATNLPFHHYASRTQKLYSPFQNSYYLPPHLNSSQTYKAVFKGQCQNWKIRKHSNYHTQTSNPYSKQNNHKSIQKRHNINGTTNYDVQYRIYQKNVSALPQRKYQEVNSRIKYLISQDKPNSTFTDYTNH